MSYDQRTWPVFLSRARINPLQELTISKSPTTVGVEKTHPPASNCHSSWCVGESWGAVDCCAKASPEKASSIWPTLRTLMRKHLQMKVHTFSLRTASPPVFRFLLLHRRVSN